MEIIRKMIQNNFTVGRSGDCVKKFVLHTQAGTGSCYNWFNAPTTRASAHYWVGQDGTVEQYVEDENTAWHCGNGDINMEAIGIEFEDKGNYNDSVRTDIMYENGSQLIAQLIKKFRAEGRDIPLEYIDVRQNFWAWGFNLHRDILNGAVACPGGLDYMRLINRAKEILNPPAPTPDPIKITFQITIGGTVTIELGDKDKAVGMFESMKSLMKPGEEIVLSDGTNKLMNYTKEMESPVVTVPAETVETLSTRLQSSMSYAVPVQLATSAVGIIVKYYNPDMPTEVVFAVTTLVGIALNVAYGGVRFLSSKYIK